MLHYITYVILTTLGAIKTSGLSIMVKVI